MRAPNARIWLALAAALLVREVFAASGRTGQLKIVVVDRNTGQPVTCRMHLLGPNGRPVKPPKVPYWHDHFVISDNLTLTLPLGNYNFIMERGLEYATRAGYFTINDFADDTKTIDLKRFVDMSKEGWWSGDLDVERSAEDLELLMEADDLHLAELVTWGNVKAAAAKPRVVAKPPGKSPPKPAGPLVNFANQRSYYLLAGADARAGGMTMLLNLKQPLAIPAAKDVFPLPTQVIVDARKQPDAWIDAAKPFGWDLPISVAVGKVDSIELAGPNLCRDSVLPETGGKPRDKVLFPDPAGVGRWGEAIYYHLLNCGLRIPPSAGSGSGSSPNPVGYNRAYVYLDSEFSYERWFEGLRAGRVMVTNGPLIRPTVEGQRPGHVFRGERGQEIELQIGLTLSTREKIDYLEVVKNGRVAFDVRLDEFVKSQGKLPHLKFDASGWFVIRAVTNNAKTYRFATTGPYYVEIGYQPRVSKTSAQFFLDWVNERAEQVKLDDADQQRQADEIFAAAREFWKNLLAKATVE